MSDTETRVQVYLCKYYKIVNPVSRHIITSYSTCSLVTTMDLEELSFLGDKVIAILKKNLEIDTSDNKIASKILGRILSENEYIKISID